MSMQSHSGFHLINGRKVTLTLFCCLLMTWQPVAAQDTDLQATVQKDAGPAGTAAEATG